MARGQPPPLDLGLRPGGGLSMASPSQGPRHLTPLRAVRARCRWCCCGSASEIELCSAKTCTLHPLRRGRGVRGRGLSVVRVIADFCRVCGGSASLDSKRLGSAQAVHACDGQLADGACPLHPYRTARARREMRQAARLAREADPATPFGDELPPAGVTTGSGAVGPEIASRPGPGA